MINGFSNPLTDESDNDKKHEPFLWCDIKCNDVCLAGYSTVFALTLNNFLRCYYVAIYFIAITTTTTC